MIIEISTVTLINVLRFGYNYEWTTNTTMNELWMNYEYNYEYNYERIMRNNKEWQPEEWCYNFLYGSKSYISVRPILPLS